jgi:hypothetical protein
MGNNLLYHYTSTDAFVGMIAGGQSLASRNVFIDKEKVLLFWANSVYTMNDPLEMMYGYDIVKKMIDRADEKNILSSYYNQIVINDYTEEEKNNLFRNHFFNVEKTPFVISLSQSQGNDSNDNNDEELFMWSMYADSGKGVRLGFGKDVIARTGCFNSQISAFPVCYDLGAFKDNYYPLLQQQVMKSYKELAKIENVEMKILKKVEIMAPLFSLFCSLIKNPKYRREREWRFVDFSRLTSFPDVKYRTRNGMIIPYVERYIAISHLKEIVIGPCCDFELQKRNIEMILKSYGIDAESVKVLKSKIPYRNL